MARRRDARVCPFCGHDFLLARAPIVATDFVTATPTRAGDATPGIDLGDHSYTDPLGDDQDTPAADPIGRRTKVVPAPGRDSTAAGEQDPPTVFGGHDVLWWPPDDEEDTGGWLDRLLPAPVSRDLKSLADFPVERLARRACPGPRCRVPLPAELDSRQAHILAVVGLNGAGKTNYLAAALTQATRSRGLRQFGVSEFAADDDTATRLHEYTTKLFREGQVFKQTQDDPDIARKPLTFRVTLEGHDPILLMTHDIRGETLMDYRSRAKITPFLSRASAVIFLVDPVEFDCIRDRLPCEAHIPGGRFIHQADLLRSCLEQLRYQIGGRPVPLALTVTKADLITDLLDGVSVTAAAAEDNDWIETVLKFGTVVRNLLMKIDEQDIVDTADAHQQVTYHAVSALGSMPSPGMRPQPIRCLEPLATVLTRLAAVL